MRVILLLAVALAATLGHLTEKENESLGMKELNPLLGVHGYPDCVQPSNVDITKQTLEENQMSMVCAQKPATAAQIKVACVGDSITAGAHSSGSAKTYPSQLQDLIGSGYSVTNLGACGSTMLKSADSPYWKRPQYAALTAAKWDIVIIMLGTNDAKDAGSHGPQNWPHDCGSIQTPSVANCQFATDYASMIEVVRGLGPSPGVSPTIYVMIPAPLMQLDSIGANQTVINTIYPKLVPLINYANKLPHAPIDVFTGLGGVLDWQKAFPALCALSSPWAPCKWFCDQQSCDQCHPNDDGYAQLALTVKAGAKL